jgi:hypothetical protein
MSRPVVMLFGTVMALGAASVATAALAAPHGGAAGGGAHVGGGGGGLSGHAGGMGGFSGHPGGMGAFSGHPGGMAFQAHPGGAGTTGGAFRGAPDGQSGGHFRSGHFHNHGGPGFGFWGPGYAYYDWGDYDNYAYDDDDGCYQARLVDTPYGLRWRRVWVCD